MAPLSRAGILSLTALTLHYCVLSITLHIARSTPGPKFHASSAVWLTELFKMFLAGCLVLWSGELRPRASERKRLREDGYEQLGMGGGVLEGDGGVVYDSEVDNGRGVGNGGDEKHRDSNGGYPHGQGHDGKEEWLEMNDTIPIHQRRAHLGHSPDVTLSLNLAQSNHNTSAPGTPSFSVIPATPLLHQLSPARLPDETALYPERPPLERYSDSVLMDALDRDWWMALKDVVFGEGYWLVGVPAGLFALQSNAQYIASGNLSVPLFQLAYQLKIPATALCSVILLNRTLTSQQWASLFLLTFGVGIVQLGSSAAPHTPSPPPPEAIDAAKSSISHAAHAAIHHARRAVLDTHADAPPNQTLGLAAVIFACLSSGFASTFFERMLKFPQSTSPSVRPSLWVRNIQLSMFGMLAGLPIVLYEMRDCVGEMGDVLYVGGDGWGGVVKGVAGAAGRTFLDGFNGLTWVVIFLQVTGGLLGAAVTLYADTILKCFSTSMSILISVVASVFLFNFQITPGVALGSSMVIVATYSYVAPTWQFRVPFRIPGLGRVAPGGGGGQS